MLAVQKARPKGYGGIKIRDRQRKAHRLAYAIAYGHLSPKLLVRHSCDNRLCCNPAHLEQGTHTDNARDRASRGRSAPKTGALNGRAKITERDVSYIRRNPQGLLQRELGAQFGIDQTVVSLIQRRKIWTHVP